MGKATEEIKVLITGDASGLNRELSVAEKAVLRAKGVVQDASGTVSGSSASWKKYRTAAVAEMEKALEGVRKTQAKIRALKEQQMQAVGLSDEDMGTFISASQQMGASDTDIQSMVADLRQPSPAVQAAYEKATAELENYKQAASEAAQSVQWLNQKVQESTSAEQAQAQAAREAAQSAKEQAYSARQAASSHSTSARASNLSRSGLARFGRTALLAMIGVRTLYAGLRRLVSALLETAKADSSLSTSLGQIKGNLGIAFQTIYQAALPALRALASMLATVTSYVAKFMALLFGISWSSASEGAEDYANSVGGAGSAAKKAAQNMMAFDELNIMNSEDDSGGGGGGGSIESIFGEEPELPEWLQNLADWLDPLIESFKNLWDSAKEFFEGVKEKLKELPGWDKFKQGLTDIRDAFISVVDYLGELFENEAFQALVAGTIDAALYLVGKALSIVAEGIVLIVSLLSGDTYGALKALFRLVIKVGNFVYDVLLRTKYLFNEIITGLVAITLNTEEGYDAWREGIEKNRAELETMLEASDQSFQEVMDDIDALFSDTGEATDEAAQKVADYRAEVESLAQALEALPEIVNIKININTSGKLDYIKGGSYATAYARGGIIRAAAGGGGFTTGQLFVAREAGPELVAGIGGGKTAVMNNDQIVQSVSDGVYKAVVEAMSTTQGSDSGDFVVKIGERELLRVMRKAERSSGYQISGNPSFAR